MSRIEIGDSFHPIGHPLPVYTMKREYMFQGKRHIVGYYVNDPSPLHYQLIGIDLPEDQLQRVESAS